MSPPATLPSSSPATAANSDRFGPARPPVPTRIQSPPGAPARIAATHPARERKVSLSGRPSRPFHSTASLSLGGRQDPGLRRDRRQKLTDRAINKLNYKCMVCRRGSPPAVLETGGRVCGFRRGRCGRCWLSRRRTAKRAVIRRAAVTGRRVDSPTDRP